MTELANEKILEIDELYEKSELPEHPNLEKAEDALVEIREMLYK